MSDCIRKVSCCFWKVSGGVRNVLDGVKKVSDVNRNMKVEVWNVRV